MERHHPDWSYDPHAAPPQPVRLPSLASLVSGPQPPSAPDAPSARETGYFPRPIQQQQFGPAPMQQHPPPYAVPNPDQYHRAHAAPAVPASPMHDPASLPPAMPSAVLDYRGPREQATPRAYQQYHQANLQSPERQHEAHAAKVAIPYTPQNLRAPVGRPKPASPPIEHTESPQGPEGTRMTGVSDSHVPVYPPAPTAEPCHTDDYRIYVRQQPVAARSCGFGERDRRVIDPPPIVQLDIQNDDISGEEKTQRLRYPYYVIHCTIFSKEGDQDCSIMPEDYRSQRRLMGSLAASPFVGKDENGVEGCFFCFSDLSCRTGGEYRLKFSLVNLEPHRGKVGKGYKIRSTTMSDVFTVYNAKEFPGMAASSPLAKTLKEQGCLISIKKGRERVGGGGRGGQDRGDSSDEGDHDDDEPSTKRKRARRN